MKTSRPEAELDRRLRTLESKLPVTGGGGATVYGEAYDASVIPTILTSLGVPLELLTYTHPTSLAAETVVQACAAGSCYSSNGSVFGGKFEFFFTVNGGAKIPCLARYFSTTNYQTPWSGTRLLTLPAGVVTIKLFTWNPLGSATQLGFNADNSIGFTYMG